MISSPIPHHLWGSSDYSQGGKGVTKPRVKFSAFLITFDTSLFLMSPTTSPKGPERLKKKKTKKNLIEHYDSKFKKSGRKRKPKYLNFHKDWLNKSWYAQAMRRLAAIRNNGAGFIDTKLHLILY